MTQQPHTNNTNTQTNTNTNTNNNNNDKLGTHPVDVEALLNVIGTRRQFPDGGPVQRMAAFVLAHLKNKGQQKEAGWGEGRGGGVYRK